MCAYKQLVFRARFARRCIYAHAHTILPASALQRQLKENRENSLILTPLDSSRTVVLCTSEHLPLGATATAVCGLLEDLVQKSLKEGRWLGIRPPNVLSSD